MMFISGARRIIVGALSVALAIALTWPAGAVIETAKAESEDTFATDYADTSRGTEALPYRVTTEQDLYDFAKAVNGAEPSDASWLATGSDADSMMGKFVSLEADITLNKAATPIGIGSNATASDTKAVCFSGTFLGNGHTISNWYSNAEANPQFGADSMTVAATKHYAGAYSAPFGAIAAATIQDVSITLKSSVSYTSSNISGLAAFVGAGASSITHCSVSGDVAVTGDHAGGLVASYGVDYGSAGTATLAIDGCYHNGSVTASGAAAGGFIGYINTAGASVSQSYQAGKVSSTKTGTAYYPNENYWGTFIGSGGSYRVDFESSVTDQDAQLYPANASKVSTTGCLSGVTDWSSDDVKAALGEERFDFDATSEGAVPPPFKSGVITKVAHTIVFEKGSGASGTTPTLDPAVEGSIITIPGAGSGSSAITRNGYDFAGWLRTDVDTDTTVYLAGDSFTMPDCAVTFTAQWTPKEATVFSTEDQLRDFANSVNAGTVSTKGNAYALGADITLTKDFVPIGTAKYPFQGVFHGNGHVVSGLSVTDDTALVSNSTIEAGLFGSINAATIDNLGVEGDIDVASATYAGGLVAQASGSYSSGSDNLSHIEGCFARVNAKGGTYVGGLIGSATYTTVSNCYATGSVVMTSDEEKAAVGGLAGNFVRGYSHHPADGEYLIANSYAACEVLATGSASTKGSLLGRVYSNADTTLVAEAAWPLLSNVWALVSMAPVYSFGVGGSEVVGTPIEDSVSATMQKSSSELKAAADVLGSCFKADNAAEYLRVNSGYPVLSWENLPRASVVQLFVSPQDAQVTFVDCQTSKQVEPLNATDTTDVRAYVYSVNSTHAYDVSVQMAGYDTVTQHLDASADKRQLTIALQVSVYSIGFYRFGGQWAQDYTAPTTYTYFDETIELPDADDVSRDGYLFLGWYTDSNYSGEPVAAIPAHSSGDRVFYSKWITTEKLKRLTALERAGKLFAEADSAAQDVAVSVDGSDVDSESFWASQSSLDALASAQSALQALCDDEDATASDINTAADALEQAIQQFVDAKRAGMKVSTQGGDSDSAAPVSGDQQASQAAVKSVVINKAKVTKKVVKAALKKANNLKATKVTLGKKVKKIAKRAFAGTKVKTLVVKTKKLTKKSVKKSLKGSKVKLVKVAVGPKKANKKFVKKYKEVFAKKVVGKKVKVKR